MDSPDINAIAEKMAAEEWSLHYHQGAAASAYRKVLPLLVECRGHIHHKEECSSTRGHDNCSCGSDDLLSKLNALLSLNPDTQKT